MVINPVAEPCRCEQIIEGEEGYALDPLAQRHGADSTASRERRRAPRCRRDESSFGRRHRDEPPAADSRAGEEQRSGNTQGDRNRTQVVFDVSGEL